MRCNIRFIAAVLAVVLLGTLSTGAVRAQDATKIAPDHYKVILDNDNVRVLEVTAKPGDKMSTHSHPDHVVYAVTGGKAKFTFPDGKSKEVEMKPGQATWVKSETHATENVGTSDLKSIVFELKKPAPEKPTAAKLADADDQAKVGKEVTKVLLDNDRVRVLDTRLASGGKLAKHSHPAHVVYVLSEGKMRGTTYPDMKTKEESVEVGKAMWREATNHSVENIGKGEMHVITVEIKD